MIFYVRIPNLVDQLNKIIFIQVENVCTVLFSILFKDY